MDNQKEKDVDNKTSSRKIIIKMKKKPDSSSSSATQSTADNQPQESPVVLDGGSTDESIRSLDRLMRVKQPAKLSDLKRRRNMNQAFADCQSEAKSFMSFESDSDTDSSGRPVKKRSLVDIYRSCERID